MIANHDGLSPWGHKKLDLNACRFPGDTRPEGPLPKGVILPPLDGPATDHYAPMGGDKPQASMSRRLAPSPLAKPAASSKAAVSKPTIKRHAPHCIIS